MILKFENLIISILFTFSVHHSVCFSVTLLPLFDRTEEAPCLGCLRSLPLDKSDPTLTYLLKLIIRKIPPLPGKPKAIIKPLEVIKFQNQVVNGILYNVDFIAAETKCTKHDIQMDHSLKSHCPFKEKGRKIKCSSTVIDKIPQAKEGGHLYSVDRLECSIMCDCNVRSTLIQIQCFEQCTMG